MGEGGAKRRMRGVSLAKALFVSAFFATVRPSPRFAAPSPDGRGTRLRSPPPRLTKIAVLGPIEHRTCYEPGRCKESAPMTLVNSLCAEISIFDGVGESTGIFVERSAIRGKKGLCKSM